MFYFFSIKDGKSVINKKIEISDLLNEFKELINLHSTKVSEYLKNEHYFLDLENTLNDEDENDLDYLRNYILILV